MTTFHTTDSEYRRYNDQPVEVLRPLTEAEADLHIVGPMYQVRFQDGREASAFEDEIRD